MLYWAYLIHKTSLWCGFFHLHLESSPTILWFVDPRARLQFPSKLADYELHVCISRLRNKNEPNDVRRIFNPWLHLLLTLIQNLDPPPLPIPPKSVPLERPLPQHFFATRPTTFASSLLAIAVFDAVERLFAHDSSAIFFL